MLKIVAVLLMLIDHIGIMLYPSNVILRIIGRLSFPLFAYSLAQGYIYTRDKNKYFKRLLIFAICSQIPFAYAFNTVHLNIGFTFCIAFICLITIDRIRADKTNILNYVLFCIMVTSASLLKVDYGYFGVLTVVVFYLFKDQTGKLFFSLLLLSSLYVSIIEIFSVISLPIIFILKKLKIDVKVPKLFFYWFYPVHLIILTLIKYIS